MKFILGLLTCVVGSITNCGTDSLFTITKLDQNPFSDVLPNQNVSLTLLYTSPEEIAGGSVETSITYNFIPFQPSVEDLCSVVMCPIHAGENDGSTSYMFPVDLSGTIIVQIKWFDTTGRLLLCIKSTLKAVKPSRMVWKFV